MEGIQNIKFGEDQTIETSSDEEWEEEYRVPTRQQTQELDCTIDMQVMVVDAFQQANDLMALEVKALDVMEEAFRVVDELQGGRNEGDTNGDVKLHFDNKGQQLLGDAEFELGDQEHNFDLVALKDAMKELYVSSKCTVHGINNKFANELFALLCHHLLLEVNCLVANYYATRDLTQKLGLDYENFYAYVKGASCFKGIIRMMSQMWKCLVQGYWKQGVAYESALPFSYNP
jgi:hypothetical protein